MVRDTPDSAASSCVPYGKACHHCCALASKSTIQARSSFRALSGLWKILEIAAASTRDCQHAQRGFGAAICGDRHRDDMRRLTTHRCAASRLPA